VGNRRLGHAPQFYPQLWQQNSPASGGRSVDINLTEFMELEWNQAHFTGAIYWPLVLSLIMVINEEQLME
jgi:hypothetical protein